MFKGKRIVLTRALAAGDEWEKALKRRGAIVYRFPTIEMAPAPLTPKLRHALTHLSDFGWVIFTSAAGAYYTKDLMGRSHIKISAKQMPPIAVIGKRTAQAVRGIGYRVRFMPSEANSVALAYELAPLKSPVLLLRSDIASPKLSQALRARGARAVELSVYQTKILRTPDARFSKLLMNGKIDYLTFASPSAVKGFFARVRGDAAKTARNIPVIAFGPRIAAILRQTGFQDIRIAREVTIKGIAEVM